MATVDLAIALRLVGGIVLLLANGFFVTTEFALTRVRQFDAAEFQTGGLRRAWEMTERLEIYLSGCQVGITISSVGLGVVAEPALAAVVDPVLRTVDLVGAASGGGHTAAAVILSLAVINLLHVVVGEQAPTYLGIERTKFVARYGGPLLYWWTKIMAPVILLSDRIAKGLLGLFGVSIDRSWAEVEMETEDGGEAGTEDGAAAADRAAPRPTSRGEVMSQMGAALAGVGVPAERRDEVLNALAIGDLAVRTIMIDREDIVAVSTTATLEENLDRMGATPHVRFPLIGADLDTIHGIVYTPLVLREREALRAGTLDLADVATAPLTVAPELPVSELIDRFQAENQELALVVEDDRTIGLVTATDAFEAIAGELRDPMDIAAHSGSD